MLSASAAARKDASTTTVLQHRHFAVIARAVASMPVDTATRSTVAWHFAAELGATNPNFDRKRFLTACGVY